MNTPPELPEADWMNHWNDAQVDDHGVDLFASAMKEKLATKRLEGYGGWNNECTPEHLAKLLVDHMPKGDPVDIANFAMMLFHRNGANAIRAYAQAARSQGVTVEMAQRAFDAYWAEPHVDPYNRIRRALEAALFGKDVT
jgi:hypothetical protein